MSEQHQSPAEALAEWVRQAHDRCAAATNGPWQALVDGTPDGDLYFVRAGQHKPHVDVLVRGGDDGQYANGTAADAAFIAAARTDLPRALEALSAVLGLADHWDGAKQYRDEDLPVSGRVYANHADNLRRTIAQRLGVDISGGPSAPRRIQVLDDPEWQLPEDAIYVGRSSSWANSWRAVPLKGQTGWCVRGNGEVSWSADDDQPWSEHDAAEHAARRYRERGIPLRSARAHSARINLRGRDLACECSLDLPCHGDVLLEIANDEGLAQRLQRHQPSASTLTSGNQPQEQS